MENREIKFRAWNNDQMVYPVNISQGKLIDRFSIIMQYTGLKDKNGKEIYEGDICTTVSHDYGIELQFVAFIEGMFVFNYHGWSMNNWKQYNIEVIGNIYENSELL